MSTVDNKELELLEAIDNYDLYTPSHRKALKTLVQLAIDGCSNNLSTFENFVMLIAS
ncbi:hypothetical protein [Candidatus Tisiphia endosymbiont of Oplodontha viridula]|uniref:hypothetical protein n=1 Tax=Candidatus Tisiphia endosymbiont of Oplodontha viridula TaxID=3077925 RepID=UPI0035C91CA3